MIHKLTIGHFDAAALKERRLVVLRSLDMNVVIRLLRDFGLVSDDGRATLGNHAVELKEGYVVCPWLMPQRNLPAEEFATQLQKETGCLLFDAARREIVTPEQFAGW